MTLDELQVQVEAISLAMCSLKDSGVSEQALILLVQHAAPTIKGNRVPAKTIKAVMDGLADLNGFLTQDPE